MRMALEVIDAVELAEMLRFLDDWLAGDSSRLAVSLERFVGHDGYGVTELRADFARFVFLLGGDAGELLFGGEQ
jgi:hypothetical protein